MSDFQSFLLENIKTLTDSGSDQSENSLDLNEFFKSNCSITQARKSLDSLASLDSIAKSQKAKLTNKSSYDMLRKSKSRRRNSSLTSRSSDKLLSSPELLSKSDFILKKHRKHKLNQRKDNWLNKPNQLELKNRNFFHLNKNCLIQSLNQLSKNSNYKNVNYSNESISDVDLNLSFSSSKSSSLDSLIIGPYLSKFEQENLNNTKSNIIRDLASKDDSISSYEKNLNKIIADSMSKPITNYDLLKASRYFIPWEYIETKSANLIIELFNSNENVYDFNFFDINGNLINHKQVYKWISILKDIYYEKLLKENEIILPINDNETSSNRIRLRTNEEIFDEVTEDSFESTSSKSDFFYRSNPARRVSPISVSNRKEPEMLKKKSPEKQILYYDWFDIIKKIQNDPNFDLETMIRTRGRFTDQQNITYRNVLKQKAREKDFNLNLSKNLTKSEINLAPKMDKFKKLPNDLDNSFFRSTAIQDEKPIKRPTEMKLTLEKNDIEYIRDAMSKKIPIEKLKRTYLEGSTINESKKSIKNNYNSSKKPTTSSIFNEFLNLKEESNQNINRMHINNSNASKNLTFLNKLFGCNRKETNICNQKQTSGELINTSFVSSLTSSSSSSATSSNNDLIYVNMDQNKIDYENSIKLKRFKQLQANKKTPPKRPPPPKVSMPNLDNSNVAQFRYIKNKNKFNSTPVPSRLE